jgi:hypothetical protein
MAHLKQLKLKFFKLIKLFFVGVQICIPTRVICQTNLVVNPDIEIYDSCPDNTGQISRATGWWQFGQDATTDFFNTCSLNPITTIPSAWGYQLPHSGNGYLHAIELWASKPSNLLVYFENIGYLQLRESIAGSFKVPLKAVPHKLEFYVNAVTSDYNSVFTDAFDMIISEQKEDVFIPVSPYIDLKRVIPIYTGDTVISDTMRWTKLSVCFLPKGGERYFTIGAFRDTSSIKLEFVEGENLGNSYIASYYFDSFKVYECDTCCIGAFDYDDAVTLVNNPSSNSNPAQFTVVLHGQTTATLTLYDSAGRLVKKMAFSDMYTQYTLDEILAQGMYHYAFESSNGTKDYGKLLVVE